MQQTRRISGGGVSVEDKKYGVPRIDHVRRAPATVRFLSIEPLLEDLGPLNLRGITWVIVARVTDQNMKTTITGFP